MARKVYGSLYVGDVEYSQEKAEISIDSLIEGLQEARDMGVTHLVGLSGNYRGAQYVPLPTEVLPLAEDWEEGDEEAPINA